MSNYNNTLFMGKVLLRYKSVKSTNLEAQALLAAGTLLEGTTLVADVQTDGKGQRGNAWTSPAGANLLSSFVLFPKHILPRQQFMLNMFTSLAVLDVLIELGIQEASVKWPNDIYIQDKKVAGILIQNNIGSHAINASVIGIGINVNQTSFAEHLPNPTSVYSALGKKMDIEVLLEHLCYFLEKRYLQSKTTDGIKALTEDYLRYMFRYQQNAPFLIDGLPVIGKIVGIDDLGKLLLEVDGQVRVCDMQKLRFVV